MFDFRRITLFCLEKCLSKHKMIIFSKNLGENGPFPPLATPMCDTNIFASSYCLLVHFYAYTYVWEKVCVCRWSISCSDLRKNNISSVEPIFKQYDLRSR